MITDINIIGKSDMGNLRFTFLFYTEEACTMYYLVFLGIQRDTDTGAKFSWNN